MLLVICWKWNFSLEWLICENKWRQFFLPWWHTALLFVKFQIFLGWNCNSFIPKPNLVAFVVTNSNLKYKQGLYSFEPHGLGLAIILPKKGTQAQEGLKFKPLEPCISQILAGSTHHFTEVEMTAQLCNNCWATYFLLLNQLRLCLLLQSHNQVHGSY